MDKQNTKNEVTAKKVLWISLVVDIIDVLSGIVVTIISGSVVMLSQVLEGIADLACSGLLVFGLKRSKKKADRNYPFGYGKELYFWALISALIMLGITSTFTFYFGLNRFLHPESLQHTFWAYLVLIFTAGTNSYALSLSIKRLLEKKSFSKLRKIFHQSALIETKTAFVLDMMGTSASILGFIALMLYGITGNGQFDGLGAMIIGVVLGILSVVLLFAVKDFLIGKGVSLHILESIKKAAGRLPYVKSVSDIKAMHIGPDKLLIHIDVNFKDNLTPDELEAMTDKVKDEIRKDIPTATYIQIELG